MKDRKLIIIGGSAFAEIAREYFEADTNYEVVAFSVESSYLTRDQLQGLPVVAFETLDQRYSPIDHDVFVAITYTQLNRLRARLVSMAKGRGYALASYISPRAFIWRNVELGEHCFVFEDNTLQPFVKIGDNVVLWSGNHIGHHSIVRSHCFISSHVVVSGFCDIGESSFLGVNCTLANNVAIGRDNWIGLGVTITHDTAPNQLFKGEQTEPTKVSALRFFKIKE